MNNKIGIYKITSPSGSIYIGQSATVGKRWAAYKNGYSKKQPKLHNSFQKHGVNAHSFELVHELPSDIDQQTIDMYEQIYIDAYVDCGCAMMNLREAGCTGRHSEESRQKMKGKLGMWMTGRKLSEETIAKRSMKQKGLKRSNESKERYRESRIAENNPMFGKIPWNKGLKGFMKGRKVTDETRVKQSIALKGKGAGIKRGPMSEETKLKISMAKNKAKCFNK